MHLCWKILKSYNYLFLLITYLFEQKNVIWTIYLSFTAIKVKYATTNINALIFMVKFVTTIDCCRIKLCQFSNEIAIYWCIVLFLDSLKDFEMTHIGSRFLFKKDISMTSNQKELIKANKLIKNSLYITKSFLETFQIYTRKEFVRSIQKFLPQSNTKF